MNKLNKLDVLKYICSFVQIGGLLLCIIIGRPDAIVLGMIGMAAIVMYFLPYHECECAWVRQYLIPVSAICGVLLIALSLIQVFDRGF